MEQHSEDSIPSLPLERVGELAWIPAAVTAESAVASPNTDATEQPPLGEEVSTHWESPVPDWLEDTGVQIVRATRSWIQYGTVGFAVMCIIIGAVEALFGR